jgi:hypothetical protein
MGSILLSNKIFFNMCGVETVVKGCDRTFYCRPGTGKLLREEVNLCNIFREKQPS